jgi:hypothetical protein
MDNVEAFVTLAQAGKIQGISEAEQRIGTSFINAPLRAYSYLSFNVHW